jgi:type II secretory pathway pseudopilin PulG
MASNQKHKSIQRLIKAFTLIEVLVYVAVLSIIVGGSASIIMAVYRNKVIVEDRVNVNEDMRLLTKSIRDDMYLGNDVVANSASSFTVSRAGEDDILYYLNGQRIYRQVGSGTAVAITAIGTDVRQFVVQDLSTPAIAKTLRIRIELSNFELGALRPEIVQDVTTTFSIKFI